MNWGALGINLVGRGTFNVTGVREVYDVATFLYRAEHAVHDLPF